MTVACEITGGRNLVSTAGRASAGRPVSFAVFMVDSAWSL